MNFIPLGVSVENTDFLQVIYNLIDSRIDTIVNKPDEVY